MLYIFHLDSGRTMNGGTISLVAYDAYLKCISAVEVTLYSYICGMCSLCILETCCII